MFLSQKDALVQITGPSSCIYVLAPAPDAQCLTNKWSECSHMVCSDAFRFAWIFLRVKRNQTMRVTLQISKHIT